MKYLKRKEDGYLLRAKAELAEELLAGELFEEVDAREYWDGQAVPTLIHFLALEAVDPTALTEEEEVLVKEFFEAKVETEEEAVANAEAEEVGEAEVVTEEEAVAEESAEAEANAEGEAEAEAEAPAESE